MAKFRTHILWGSAWGAAAGTAAFFSGWCDPVQAATAGVLGVIASGLPDVDSTNAKPRQLLLGVLGVGIPVLLAGRVFPRELRLEELFCRMIAAFLVIRYGIGFLLEKFSRHRGAFHSIPAAILAGEAVYLIFMESDLPVRMAFALSAAGGYISHLLLDEYCSFNFIGATDKKSAGTAFTWKLETWTGTFLLYFIIIAVSAVCVYTT